MMNNDLMIHASILLIGTFLSAISQVMLKKAAMKKYRNRFLEYLNPLVIGAYIIFFCTTFLSIIAYRGIPLSMGPVLEATSYVYVTLFGHFLFQEKITLKKLTALAYIIIGIVIYSIGG